MSTKILGGLRKKKEPFRYDKGQPEKLFDLLECLGEGTYGTVWTGLEKKTNRTCAVKIVTIDDDLEEIEQEIAIMRDSDSPYVVKFYGCYCGSEKGKIWMVMEHCVAGSLNDLMYVCDITLDVDQIRTTAAAMCLGLKYLHANLIIHRDIKAGNVLLTHDGHIRLSDFGVSAKLKKPSDRTNTAIGAPFWMAPEVISEIPYDGRADVWSLGITLIELAEGRPPNSHINPMKALFIIPQQQPPTLQDQDKWPKDFKEFVKTCLVKEPKKRPRSDKILKHPFIMTEAKTVDAAGGRSVIIHKLVKASLKKIEKWRNDEEDDKSQGTKNSHSNLQNTTKSDKSSLTELQNQPSTKLPLPKPVQKTPVEDEEEEVELFTPNLIGSTSKTVKTTTSDKSSKAEKVKPKDEDEESEVEIVYVNAIKDGRIRESMRQLKQTARKNLAPLRDVVDPEEKAALQRGSVTSQNGSFINKAHQKELSVEDVANIMNSDLPAHSNQVQAAVMTKEFIVLLKSIYRNDPQAFGGKPLKNWTGEDITVAVVKALHSVLGSDVDSNGKDKMMSDYRQAKSDTNSKELPKNANSASAKKPNLDLTKEDDFDYSQFNEDNEEAEFEETRDDRELKNFMKGYGLGLEFDAEKDGDMPPPPPEDSDVDSDIEI